MPTKQDYHIDNFLKEKQYNLIHCVVDTDNKFKYNSNKYLISEKAKQYKVHNKAKRLTNGSLNNFTNESEMDCVYVAECNDKIYFFDQDKYRIHPALISQQ